MAFDINNKNWVLSVHNILLRAGKRQEVYSKWKKKKGGVEVPSLMSVPKIQTNKRCADHEIKEIYAYGVGLQSILSITGLSKFINLESLSLHGNQIERIQGLEVLQTLKTLNLSSNNISQMEGLSHLQNLHVLNLASNQLREISGLHGLMALRVLVLSHNRISLLGGLSTLHGPKYSLEKLDLRDNAVEYLCELWVIAGCVHLRELTLSHGSHTNPVCWAKSYQTTILSAVPHLRSLDGKLLDKKDDAIIDLEAVSVPPLPVWALQRCYPPQHNCPELPRLCSHLPTAPKASKYPSAKVQRAAQQHYRNPVQAAMQAKDVANSMHNFQPERRNQSSDPRQIHLPYDNVVKANYGGSSLEPVNHQRQVEDKWRMPLPESNVGAVSHMRWSPANQGERQLPQGPQLYNPFEAVPVDEMVRSDVPTNIQGGQTHALYGALATPHIDHALLGFHRRKKLHQSGGGEAIMEEPLQKETQNYEVWFKRLESQIIDLVHQISKTKADGTKRSSGMDSTTKTTKVHRDTDDDSSDLSLGNSPPKQSSVTPNHIPKFAGQKKKWCSVQAIRKMQKMAKHSSVQTESMEEPLLKCLCQEVGRLQAEFANMAAKREQGGISTKSAENKILDSEQKEFALRAEISKKDMEICKLTENRKFLEDEIAAIKHTLARDKERWEHETEQKVVTIKSLETKVQECEAEVQKVRDIESNKERQFLMEQSQVAASMQAKTEAKISALSCEVVALKECYDAARMACQDAEKALEAVTAEKEKSNQFATALKKVLKEQSAKLRMYDNERESWRVKEKKLREDNNKLVRDAEAALTEIRELKTMDLDKKRKLEEIEQESEARGQAKAEKATEVVIYNLQTKLSSTQFELCEARQEVCRKYAENARNMQLIRKLREDTQKEVMGMREVLQAVREKERGAEELVTELSEVVRSQKLRLQKAQQDLEHSAASEQEAAQLRIEVGRLKEKADALEEMSREIVGLKNELANASGKAERERLSFEQATQLQLSVLKEENRRLTAEVAASTHKLQETEDAVRVKTKMLDSQNDTIAGLKKELVEAKDAARGSASSIKARDANWMNRLQEEVEQRQVLQAEVMAQEGTIAEMEMDLKIAKTAKNAAENTCKMLQQKVNDMDTMLRYVENEIRSVKSLYESREKGVIIQRDQALEELKLTQKKMEEAEAKAAAAIQCQIETTKAMEAHEKSATAALLEKDKAVAEASRKVLEIEAEMHSRISILEKKKAISSAQVSKLCNVLEELKEAT